MPNYLAQPALWTAIESDTNPPASWNAGDSTYEIVTAGISNYGLRSSALPAAGTVEGTVTLLAADPWYGGPTYMAVYNGDPANGGTELAMIPLTIDVPLELYVDVPAGADVWLFFATTSGELGSYYSIEASIAVELEWESEVFVYTLNQVGKIGAWSRYVFPFAIDAYAQRGNSMFVRNGDTVFEITHDAGTVDFEGSPEEQPFEAVLHWPFLDFGSPGTETQLNGFDVVGFGQASISVGWEQKQITNPAFYTEPFLMPEDSLTGDMIPLPVVAPTMSLKLVYQGGQDWQFNALNIYTG